LAALAPERWGQGYATEALRSILAYAFNTLAQQQLAAANDLPNVASERMLMRLGFTQHSEVQGPKYPLRTYLLTQQAWQQLNG
jgi:[ribosomal protein S5]-alanine N-acetyltransferase